MTPRRSALALALLALLIHPHEPGAQPATVRPVVAAGQPAPGGGTFEHFSVESLPILAPVNRKGQVAFFATLLRGAAGEGLFLASGRRITKLALEGDAVPGVGTLSGFGKHPIPALNESGAVAFAAAVVGGKTVEGIFLSFRGRLQPVALSGGLAPGVPAGTLANLEAPALNDRGDVAFLATVRRGRESVEALYLRSGGKLRKVVAQGDPAPAGGTFAGFGAPALNNKGLVAFGAAVEGRAVPGGIFVAEGNRIRMLVGAGDDTPIGGIFSKFAERVSMNDAGVVSFNAVLKDAPSAGAIFLIDGGTPSGAAPTRVVARGDAAPGGGTFSYFGLWPALNAAGAVAFAASVEGGPSPVGIFLADATGLMKVAGVGDTPTGGDRIASLTLYPLAALSPTGAVTFAVTPNSGGEGAEAIFLATPASRP